MNSRLLYDIHHSFCELPPCPFLSPPFPFSVQRADASKIPPKTYVVGEVWSQLVAYGPYFADETNPRPMVYVGNPGDQGIVEMQDLLFTSVGSLPGLVLMQWNIQGVPAASAAMWGEL